ncbi:MULTISPECIES: S1C family serine protease [Silvimonas]|uniref:S1C family serine protease n=1 Tax=Silvimonas TaxID=300264 RepID=UPI0024B36BF8|nr:MULTISPECIES: serine protease [Silvimonas]MDR3426452.1 serine protease [Silvimonas sp.]
MPAYILNKFPNLLAVCLFLLTVVVASVSRAETVSPDTSQVFRQYKDAVVQVRIMDKRSNNRSALGTGFAVDDAGHIISNFHVISSLAWHPEWFRAEAVRANGSVVPLAVIGFDVVHDLSLLKIATPLPTHLELDAGPLDKGTTLYSFGIPLDLDFTIVRGLYNGLIDKSLREQIHFTGAINPGMSGGPTVTEAGRVIGINVATSGNDVGFLVPAKYAVALLQQSTNPPMTTSTQMLKLVDQQLLASQDAVVARLLAAPLKLDSVGHYRTARDWSDFFRCWGNEIRGDDKRYTAQTMRCGSQSSIFLTEEYETGTVYYSSSYVQSKGLNDQQFAHLYGGLFSVDPPLPDATREDVGNFSCKTAFVHQPDGLPLKNVFCLRAYRKLPGLYDAVMMSATLDQSQNGLINRLVVGGISYNNAVKLARKFLGATAWANH